jgi:hypothetical protein
MPACIDSETFLSQNPIVQERMETTVILGASMTKFAFIGTRFA